MRHNIIRTYNFTQAMISKLISKVILVIIIIIHLIITDGVFLV